MARLDSVNAFHTLGFPYGEHVCSDDMGMLVQQREAKWVSKRCEVQVNT